MEFSNLILFLISILVSTVYIKFEQADSGCLLIPNAPQYYVPIDYPTKNVMGSSSGQYYFSINGSYIKRTYYNSASEQFSQGVCLFTYAFEYWGQKGFFSIVNDLPIPNNGQLMHLRADDIYCWQIIRYEFFPSGENYGWSKIACENGIANLDYPRRSESRGSDFIFSKECSDLCHSSDGYNVRGIISCPGETLIEKYLDYGIVYKNGTVSCDTGHFGNACNYNYITCHGNCEIFGKCVFDESFPNRGRCVCPSNRSGDACEKFVVDTLYNSASYSLYYTTQLQGIVIGILSAAIVVVIIIFILVNVIFALISIAKCIKKNREEKVEEKKSQLMDIIKEGNRVKELDELNPELQSNSDDIKY
jgi:uncharacterized membrane protein